MSNSPRLDVALAYARAGIPVFPCHPGTKVPATLRGFHDATTDLAVLKGWWATADYNPAFCPQLAGFGVVDIDPGGEAEWTNLQVEHGQAAETYTVSTPRGGRHIYFRGELPPTQHVLGAHIDTRGVGSYVLLPSSYTDDGTYAVLQELPVTDVPPWLASKLTVVREKNLASVGDADLPWNVERAERYLEGLVAQGDVAREGLGGDKRTFRVFCEAIDLGLSAGKAYELVSRIWNPHCVPPWDDAELRTKAHNAGAYRQNEIGAWGAPDFNDAFGAAVANLPPELRSDAPTRSRFHFEDEDEQELTPAQSWLVPGLLPEGATVLLYGVSGSFKSFAALDLALAISAGVETFGVTPVRSGPTFYCALEGRNSTKKERRRAWRAARGITGRLDNFFVGPAPRLAQDGEIGEFLEAIAARTRGQAPALIVLETLAKVMSGMNEDKSQDAGQFVELCDRLKDTFRCTVMAVHHASDATGSDGKRMRGSSAIRAGFDTIIRVDRPVKNGPVVQVYAEQHKDAEEPAKPWNFEARPSEGSLALHLVTYERVQTLVQVDEGMSHQQVGAILKDLGAFGVENGVMTQVLARRLVPQQQDESYEAWMIRLEKTIHALTKLGRTKLSGLATRTPAGVMWSLLAPEPA